MYRIPEDDILIDITAKTGIPIKQVYYLEAFAKSGYDIVINEDVRFPDSWSDDDFYLIIGGQEEPDAVFVNSIRMEEMPSAFPFGLQRSTTVYRLTPEMILDGRLNAFTLRFSGDRPGLQNGFRFYRPRWPWAPLLQVYKGISLYLPMLLCLLAVTGGVAFLVLGLVKGRKRSVFSGLTGLLVAAVYLWQALDTYLPDIFYLGSYLSLITAAAAVFWLFSLRSGRNKAGGWVLPVFAFVLTSFYTGLLYLVHIGWTFRLPVLGAIQLQNLDVPAFPVFHFFLILLTALFILFSGRREETEKPALPSFVFYLAGAAAVGVIWFFTRSFDVFILNQYGLPLAVLIGMLLSLPGNKTAQKAVEKQESKKIPEDLPEAEIVIEDAAETGETVVAAEDDEASAELIPEDEDYDEDISSVEVAEEVPAESSEKSVREMPSAESLEPVAAPSSFPLPLAGSLAKELLPRRLYFDPEWDLAVGHGMKSGVPALFYDFYKDRQQAVKGFACFQLPGHDQNTVLSAALIKTVSQDSFIREESHKDMLQTVNRSILKSLEGKEFSVPAVSVRLGNKGVDIMNLAFPSVFLKPSKSDQWAVLNFQKNHQAVTIGSSALYTSAVPTARISVSPGDRLIFSSPALLSQLNRTGKGSQLWTRCIKNANGKTAEELRDDILNRLKDIMNSNLVDVDFFFAVLIKK